MKMTVGNPYVPVQARKKRHWPLFVLVLLGLLVLVCTAGVWLAVLAPPPDKPHAINLPSDSIGSTTVSGLGAGDYAVGKEIKPGTYEGSTDGVNCYWARVKDFDGALDSVITNGNIAPGQNVKVAVKASDKGLSLVGDCVFRRAG
jgi:hypothetical protein